MAKKAYRASCPAYQAVLDRFDQHMTVRGMAASTRLNYVRAMRDAQEHTGKVAEALTRDDLLAYLSLRRKPCSPSTLNTQVCAPHH